MLIAEETPPSRVRQLQQPTRETVSQRKNRASKIVEVLGDAVAFLRQQEPLSFEYVPLSQRSYK